MSGFPLVLRSYIPDYTPVITTNLIKFIVAERKMKSDWKSITRPFFLELWIALGISIVLLGIILPQIINCGQNIKKSRNFWSLQKAFMFLLASCCMKGTNLNNTMGYSSRLSIGLCLLLISVLGFGYSGTLISFLTTPSYEPAPRTINELATAVKNGEYSCGTIRNRIAFNLPGNKSTDIEILRNYMEKNPDMLRFL
ncbi:uncharacterized protein [Centruroides vittatus]|uniref:uncharacterized protein n=1 Tax=Centruroides vittatus TaxID=120091 RepID=UPI00350EE681